MQLTRLLDFLSSSALESVAAATSVVEAERSGDQAGDLGYLRRCDIAVFPELKPMKPSAQDLSISSAQSASKRSHVEASSGAGVAVSRFQKKRKRLGRQSHNESAVDVLSSSPSTPGSASPGGVLPRSPSLASVKTVDDEYDCFSSPPSVRSEAEDSPDPGDAPYIGPADLFTGVLRLLQNMSHRCVSTCLHMCAAGALDACVACLEDWFHLRQRLSTDPSNQVDVQVRIYSAYGQLCLRLMVYPMFTVLY